MRRIFENGALILFVLFVASGFIYSFTQSRGQGQTRSDLINACNQAEQRSIVFQNFALEASAARRRNAEVLFNQGKKVAAQNEIATAKKYESFAKQWDELTVHNCEEFYG